MSHSDASASLSVIRRRRPAPRRRPAAPAILLLLGLALAACGPAPVTPPPSAPGSPSPSIAPSPTSITTPEAAAARVLASDPRFAGLGIQDPDLIGQCCSWTATPAADGFEVTIEIGWGDCPAGCINRHRWFYSVATDGTIRLDREDGPPVPAGIPGPVDGTTGVIGIRGIASAGPACPVVRPNDPNCADRPVVGATIHVLDATGLEVATLETDATGAFVVALPPGRYRVQADAVEGLMGTPSPADVTVGDAQELVQLVYDTGIR
jgi:hypothetical protein